MFWQLLKIRLRYFFSNMGKTGESNPKKRGAVGKALIALLFVYLVAIILIAMGMMFFSLCEPFAAMGLDWLYFALAGLIAFLLCFVGSVFMAKNQLYEATDNELLMSMPIKPSAILASRLAALIAINVLYQSIILIPAYVVHVYVLGFSLPVLVMFILGFILLPLLVATFSAIGGYLLELLSSVLPKKNVLETALYLLFLGAYFYFYTKMSDYMTYLAQNGESIADAVRRAVPPAYFFGMAISRASVLHMVYFALCAVVPMALMCYVLSRSYLKIMGTKRGAAKVKYKGDRLKKASVRSALLRREIMHFANNPMYIMNAALGTLFLIVAAVALVIKKDDIIGLVIPVIELLGMPAPVIAAAAICALASMNMISAPSISIEGNTLWLIRSLPVDSGDVLLAKAKCHFIMTMPAALLAAIVAAVILRADIIGIAVMVLLPAVFIAFFALLGVVMNLRFPKMNWINEVYAVKQSMSSGLTMMLSMTSVFAIALLYAFVLSDYMDLTAYAAAVGAVMLISDILMYRYLRTGGKKRFEAI